MEPQRPIDILIHVLSAWLAAVARHHLDDERRKVLFACLDADQADVYIVVRLREGAIVLDGINLANGTRYELWREEVQSLTPVSGFAMPETDRKQ
jgi:hypothetical protein